MEKLQILNIKVEKAWYFLSKVLGVRSPEFVDESDFDNDSDFDFAAVTPVDEAVEAGTPVFGEPGNDENLDIQPGQAQNYYEICNFPFGIFPLGVKRFVFKLSIIFDPGGIFELI